MNYTCSSILLYFTFNEFNHYKGRTGRKLNEPLTPNVVDLLCIVSEKGGLFTCH